jgi:hypothetical protein
MRIMEYNYGSKTLPPKASLFVHWIRVDRRLSGANMIRPAMRTSARVGRTSQSANVNFPNEPSPNYGHLVPNENPRPPASLIQEIPPPQGRHPRNIQRLHSHFRTLPIRRPIFSKCTPTPGKPSLETRRAAQNAAISGRKTRHSVDEPQDQRTGAKRP